MVENSIVAELMQQINLTKLRPNPNYLSASDTLTVEEFEQTEYGNEYSMDVSNIDWGNASNDSHVFDIFSEFSAHQDSLTSWQPTINDTSGTAMCSLVCTKYI